MDYIQLRMMMHDSTDTQARGKEQVRAAGYIAASGYRLQQKYGLDSTLPILIKAAKIYSQKLNPTLTKNLQAAIKGKAAGLNTITKPRATVMDCPEGLIFNDELNICDWPSNCENCGTQYIVMDDGTMMPMVTISASCYDRYDMEFDMYRTAYPEGYAAVFGDWASSADRRAQMRNDFNYHDCYIVQLDYLDKIYEEQYKYNNTTNQTGDDTNGDGGNGGGGGTTTNPNDVSNYTFVAGAGEGINPIEYLKCFTNSYSIYKITVGVDQPIPGSRATHTRGNGGTSSGSSKGGDIDVGHTFLILEEVKSNGTSITRVLGFYPSKGVNPINPSSNGSFIDDGGHHFDVSLTTTVNKATFSSAINTLKLGPEVYNLNSNNCTTFCIDLLNALGISLPKTSGSWPLDSGANPGDLGEDIRTIPLGSNQTRNTSGGSASENKGSCPN
ncbi:MAG: chitin binding peritrophin-A domain-containing protein [Niabella sp.]